MWPLPTNPAAELERHPDRQSGDIDVYAPEGVWALARAAFDERDAAVYITAAFTGLRMGELRALRWRDVDFPRSVIHVRASYAEGELSVPKSGKVRSVPMVPEVAHTLARLNERDEWTGEDDLVFAEPHGDFLNDDKLRRGTPRPSRPPACAACASTTSATPLARSSSLGRTSFRFKRGWDTRTSRRRCASCTTATAAGQPLA